MLAHTWRSNCPSCSGSPTTCGDTGPRSGDRPGRYAAVREAIATSPYTWEDLSADGVRDWVEESVGDDVLLAAALESLGELAPEERPYLGKFVVERIYEILTDAEARYWFRTPRKLRAPNLRREYP